MKKLTLFNISILLFICSVSIFIFSTFANRGYFSALSLQNVAVYEFKQFVALMIPVILGFLFLKAAAPGIPALLRLALALPAGLSLYAVCSLLLLMAGVRYSLFSGLLFSAALTALIFIVRSRGAKKATHNTPDKARDRAGIIPLLIILTSLALICSSGFVFSFVSYDSFYYFINYGHALAVTGNFRELLGNNAFTLTNIGQFVPILCSYLSFFGLDQPYSLQAFLSYDTVIVFMLTLHQLLKGLGVPGKRAVIFTGLFSLILISSTSYLIISSWMLANMYCMVYIFIAVAACLLCQEGILGLWETGFLTALSYVSLTLIRKDGIIFSAFFFVCFICMNSRLSKGKLALIYAPAAAFELAWLIFVRLVLEASVSQSAPQSIANNKNIFFIMAIITAAFLYLAVFHDLFGKLLKAAPKSPLFSHYTIFFAGLLAMLGAAFLLRGDLVIDNVDFTIRNIFMYPSPWGISGFIFGLLLVLSMLKAPCLDALNFLWAGYALLNLVSYSLVDSKALWVNWDDSYSRVLMQIVPVFLLVMALKITRSCRD